MTPTERLVEQVPEENVRGSSDAEQVSEDSCPPLQRRPRSGDVSAEVSTGSQMPAPVIPSSDAPVSSSSVLPARRAISIPVASTTPLPPVTSSRPILSTIPEAGLQVPVSSSTTPPVTVPFSQSPPVPVQSTPTSVTVSEAELSVEDYPAPNDNIFFTSVGVGSSAENIRWESQGADFVEPLTLADCCHQLKQFISLGLTGDPPMPPWELRYITRYMYQKFPTLSAEDAARLAEMDIFLEQMEMTCIASRPTREYYAKSAQDALAKLEQWKESRKAQVADRARLLDSKQAQMQSISSLRAKIAELQRTLEQQLQEAEETDRQLAVLESRMPELPSAARINLTRWMAEDRLADSRKVVDDLRAVWPTHASALAANIPQVAEGMALPVRGLVLC